MKGIREMEKDQVIKKENLVKLVSQGLFDRTQKWAEEQGLIEIEKDKEKVSEKAKKLAKIFDEHQFQGHHNIVIEIVETIIGEKLPYKEDKTEIDYKFGVVVVPLTTSNFTIGNPVIVADSIGHVISTISNEDDKCLPYTRNFSINFIRPAELVEIEALVEELMGMDEFNDSLLSLALYQIGKGE